MKKKQVTSVVRRTAKKTLDNKSAELVSKVPKSTTGPKAKGSTKASLHGQSLSKLDLQEFVRQAWSILEPVTDLQWNWHLDLICDHLSLVQNNTFRTAVGTKIEGVIFNVPPRTMKSLLITVFFPCWLWTSDPSRRFMFVSYSEKVSTQHSVYRRCIMESDWYRQRWGRVFKLNKDQNLKSHYENSRRGVMFSTGMQATATGMGGDILIFDDPLNPEQALSQVEREAVNLRFDATFRSRINNAATGVKIVIMQRLHEQDLTGHILRKESDRWLHLSLPAIMEKAENWSSPLTHIDHTFAPGALLWEQRLPQSFLDSQKIGMGIWAFSGQYQQNPAPMDGGIIKRQWIKFYRELPQLDFMVQSWDCTFTGSDRSDFVAGQVWARGGGKYFMLPYRVYERLDFAPIKAAIKSCHALFPHANAVLIEDKANGPAIISELQKEIPGIVAVAPGGGKMSRAQAMAPLWEAGSIELPDPQVFDVPWIESYIHNICTFPKAAHDDDVDATSQALIYMRGTMVDGILQFYRLEGKKTVVKPERPTLQEVFSDSPATRVILEALTDGHQIQCSERQYVEIRQVLLRAMELWKDPKDVGRYLFVASEVQRLDHLFNKL